MSVPRKLKDNARSRAMRGKRHALGVIRSPETRAKMRAAVRARYVPVCSRDLLVALYVEQCMTMDEVAEKLGCSRKPVSTAMRHYGIKARPAVPRNQRGSASPSWLGDDATYKALHLRVSKERGRPARCETCGQDSPERRYDWANLSGRYADVNDYIRVCRPCHRKVDAGSYPRDPVTGRFLPKGVVANAS